MASNTKSHRRNQSTPDTPTSSIPLQDFGHVPSRDDARGGYSDETGSGASTNTHRRTLSDRGRSLFRRKDNILSKSPQRYTPIGEDEGSPSPPKRRAPPDPSPTLRIIAPSGQYSTSSVSGQYSTSSVSGQYSTSSASGQYGHHVHLEEETTPLSPIGPGYQDAIGFAGLSFHGPTSRPSLHTNTPGRPNRNSLSTLRTIDTSPGSLLDDAHDDPTDYFPHESDLDTAPLTDASHSHSHSHLQPSTSLNPPSTPNNQHDKPRGSFQSIRFLSPTVSHLGDDMRDAESGTLTPDGRWSRSPDASRRSLSPASESPLTKAGHMMRKMSQRVVNLSNEADLVERDIRRRGSSVAHSPDSRIPLPKLNTDLHDYSGDASASVKSPVSEKMPSPVLTPADHLDLPPHPHHQNPLRGKSLGIFSPNSRIRLKLMDILLHPFTEPFILVLIVLQTILLAVEARQSVYTHPRLRDWGNTWIDFAILALFIIYTLETICRIIVSGFIVNPVEYSTINRQIGIKQAIAKKANDMFALHRRPSVKQADNHFVVQQTPGLIRALTRADTFADAPGGSLLAQKARLAHRAFLRHSFNRLDFVAISAYWISFVIGIFGVESQKHVFVFKMLSCLRILRLLGITSGTSVILRSLKKAAPSLLNVGLLIGFFWLLMAIIGIQSFKSSFRRTCVWLDPGGNSDNNYVNDFVFCGGHLNGTYQNFTMEPWVHANGLPGAAVHKGYLCPIGSQCIEGSNPYNGTASFDNLVQSLELVFVIMTSNTFSDLLYYTTDSDYLASALFFAAGIIIFPLWLINLLIAVITSSFQVIRDESKASAFTAQQQHALTDEDSAEKPPPKVSKLKQWYDKTKSVWIAVIAFGLIVSALRSDTMSPSRASFINASELGVTIVLLFEIILRFVVDWRHFFHSKRNCVDLALALVTTIIQIPPIKNSGQPYSWLTIFQVLRIYRVVLAVDLTRDLIMTVLGNFSGLANLILFVFLLCFLAAIFATQIFRGELPEQSDDGETLEVSFFTIWNAFLGMYQIFSSENWTDILYNVTSYNVIWDNGWIGAGFCILWFILANFVVLNMFIAVIQENFDVSEDEKRLQQVKAFLSQRDMGAGGQGTLSLSTIFKFGQVRRQDPLDYGSAAAEMLLKDAVVRDFLDDENGEPPDTGSPPDTAGLPHRPTPVVKTGILANLWEKTYDRLFNREPNPFYSRLEFSRAHEELDPRQMAKEVVAASERRKRAQRDYLRRYPKYNVSLYIFPVNNPVRRICQRIVGPGRGGNRIEGVSPNRIVWYTFSAFIYAAIVAMVLLACVTTPLYQKVYFETHDFSVQNWFVYSDMGFAALFTVESLIRIIADGFFWTPNAYYRSSWGFIDGVVLVTLWANIITLLYDPAGGSRAIGAFKALRALRLLNVSDSARETFHSVIVMGGWKVISAAFVSLSLLVPFAIYGLNLFNGRMMSCNDSSSNIYNLTDCTGEYMSSPYNWDVLAPRQVSNSYYDFDNFGGALFILFQIVSQEGWIDVMWSAQSITGIFTQPSDFASQGNAVFFVVFNLLGAVFVLTLFVSVFMRNYTEQTGVAYLTTDQRSWLELRKLLRQISPSKRSAKKENERAKWKQWCYKLAVQKSGRWQRTVTAVLVFHLILLCLEWYPSDSLWLRTRDYIFLALTFFYVANIAIRIFGLTWARFRRSAWDLYSIFSVFGTLAASILLLTDIQRREYVQLHKLFLVSIALLLIPRNNQLDQLFKTAAASVTQIGNLLATWFVLFLVYAIAFTQTFGLTRFNSNEDGNINFRTVPKALILLFRMSSGEGWNQVMVDFADVVPPFCTVGNHYFDGDCGSTAWANALFVSWNILSMYIFVNLFVSLIYESFSYVYQRSSGLSVISREEIRRFKQAWAEFDPSGSGFISKEKFPRLLGELSGVFEMRIYDGDFTVSNILEDVLPQKPHRAPALAFDGSSIHESMHPGHTKKRPIDTPIDIEALNARLSEIPVDEIRRRRTRMNTFYEEVLVSADLDRGIEFTSLLMILAHYKVINDNKSLRLEEFLRRRARLQRVDEAVRRNIVVGFFDTLYWSRRFRRGIEARKRAKQDALTTGRLQGVPQLDVPEIFVQDESDDDATTHNDSRSIRSDGASYNSVPVTPVDKEGPSFWSDIPISPTGGFGEGAWPTDDRGRSNSVQVSPNQSPTRNRFASSTRGHSPPGITTGATMRLPEDWQFANALVGDGAGLGRRSPSPVNSLVSPTLTTSQHLDPFDFLGDGSADLGLASLGGGNRTTITSRENRSRAGTLSAAGPSRARAGTLSVPGGPGEGSASGSEGNRSRAASSVSARDLVLGELENSAWGESIRRSFTTAARPRESGMRKSSTQRGSAGSNGRGSPSPGR